MTTVAGTDVGGAVVDAITGQCDLLTTLSLAVIGGLFAFAIQIIIHNGGQGGGKIALLSLWAWWLCVAVEFLSIVMGYLVRGTLVNSIPAIFGASFSADAPLHNSVIDGLDLARQLALLQFTLFALGILAMLIFMFRNRDKLHAP